MRFPKGVKIWGKVYTLPKLKKIGKGKIEDDLLKWEGQYLDYISDCDLVRQHFVYRWVFKNKQTEKQVDVYVVHYPDTNTIAFNGDCEEDFIYYKQ